MCVINDTQKNKCTNRSASKLQHMQYVGKSGFQIQYYHVYPRNLKALNGLSLTKKMVSKLSVPKKMRGGGEIEMCFEMTL